MVHLEPAGRGSLSEQFREVTFPQLAARPESCCVGQPSRRVNASRSTHASSSFRVNTHAPVAGRSKLIFPSILETVFGQCQGGGPLLLSPPHRLEIRLREQYHEAYSEQRCRSFETPTELQRSVGDQMLNKPPSWLCTSSALIRATKFPRLPVPAIQFHRHPAFPTARPPTQPAHDRARRD